MAVWITSDLHYNHNKDFIYKPRGFNSVDEMNKAILKTWDRQVKENDVVYILGDLSLNLNSEELKKFVESLKGEIHIILGNHDTITREQVYRECKNVVEVTIAKVLKYKGFTFYLSHYPILVSNIREQPRYCLCGHTHTKNPLEHWSLGNIIHIELDAWNNTLVSIDSVINLIKENS